MFCPIMSVQGRRDCMNGKRAEGTKEAFWDECALYDDVRKMCVIKSKIDVDEMIYEELKMIREHMENKE